MMKRKFLFSFLLIAMSAMAMAQFTVSGKVYNAENGQPLPGAHIILQDTYLQTVSNANGAFVLKKVKGETVRLHITYLGFEPLDKEIKVGGDTHIECALKPVSFMSEEVIISAIRASGNTPTTYSTIDKKAINERNTARDLPYLLSGVPSAVITSDAGAGVGYTGIRIRGTDLTGINVTLNGVPVNDGESQSVYFVDLPDLAATVNDIQVQRGVGTSTNGAASFGASINIKTETLKPDPWAVLSTSVGSFNTLKNSLGFGTGLINNKWNVDGRISGISSDGYIDRAWSKLYSASFSAGYYGKKDVVKVMAMIGQEETYQAWDGVPLDSLSENRTYNPAGEIYNQQGDFLGYYDNQIDHYNQNYYQLHYAHEFSRAVNLVSTAFLTRGKGYYESYKNNRSFSDYGLMDTIIGQDTVRETNLIQQKWLDNYYYGLNVALNVAKERIDVKAGAGWSKYDGDHFGKVVWAQVARLGEYDRNWYFNKGAKEELNAFAKTTYFLNEQISLYADLQFRSIRYKMSGLHDDFSDLTQTHQFNFFNPKAGIFYQPENKHSLYFSVGVANREPGRSVYRDANPGEQVLPEKLTDFELGYRFKAGSVNLEANLYYMSYKNQLVLTGKINDVGDAIKTNVARSYRTGIEVMAGLRFLNKVEWNLTGAFSENKIKDFISYTDDWYTWPEQRIDTLGNTDISFSPAVVAGSDLSLLLFKDLKMSLISHFVGRQYIDNTQTKSRSLDPYLVNDIRINYTLRPSWLKKIDLLISLNNIFSEKYSSNAWVYSYYNGGNQPEQLNGYFPQATINCTFGISIHL